MCRRWRWIFIIEGAITVVAGVGSWFIIVDFPDSDKNTFLTPEERAFVKARLVADRGPEEREKVTIKIVLKTAADWKPWAFSLMYMAGAVGVYAFLFFLPIILRGGLGYSLEMSFILSTPPSLFAVVSAMTVSWLADKVKLRGPFVILQGLIGVVGLCMTGFLDSPTPRYIGTFLGVAGANGLVVTTLAWQANNIVGDARRAVSTGILISMSGVGGIYSSMVFRKYYSWCCHIWKAQHLILNRSTGRAQLHPRPRCCYGHQHCSYSSRSIDYGSTEDPEQAGR